MIDDARRFGDWFSVFALCVCLALVALDDAIVMAATSAALLLFGGVLIWWKSAS